MSRKKAEFTNLGTLPKGEWTIVQATVSGSLMLACAEHEPMVISNGKLTTLSESMKGKADANEES